MADFDGSVSQIDVPSSDTMPVMKHRGFEIVCAMLLMGTTLPAHLVGQTENSSTSAQAAADGPYARIALFHPQDGHTVDFEAGYIRHLAWHQQAKDTWVWYGWTITFGERQRWFVYATFGHAAGDFDNPVLPTDDERDNVLNVAPHVEQWANALYEYLPDLSRGTGVPTPTARLELTTVDLNAGAIQEFEAALSADQSRSRGETLWFRMVAGGSAPRYVRLCPRPSLAAILDDRREQSLLDKVNDFIAKMTVEILTLRPTMSLGVSPAR